MWNLITRQNLNSLWTSDATATYIWVNIGFGAVRQQAIAWTNVDFSLVRLPGIHLRTISQWVPKLLILYNEFDDYDLEITATSPRDQWVNAIGVYHRA